MTVRHQNPARFASCMDRSPDARVRSAMTPRRTPPRCRAAALLAALLFGGLAAPAAAATWKWQDAAGQTVYSDRPPPPGTRVMQMIAPSGAAEAPAQAQGTQAQGTASHGAVSQNADPAATAEAGKPAAGNPNGADAGTASDAKPSGPAPNKWVERAAASRKQAEERAQAEKHKADERRQLAERERACDEARTGLRTLESGMRLNVVDAKGERKVLDDSERGAKIDEMRRSLAERCDKRG